MSSAAGPSRRPNTPQICHGVKLRVGVYSTNDVCGWCHAALSCTGAGQQKVPVVPVRPSFQSYSFGIDRDSAATAGPATAGLAARQARPLASPLPPSESRACSALTTAPKEGAAGVVAAPPTHLPPIPRVGGAFPSPEGRVSLYTCIVYVFRMYQA